MEVPNYIKDFVSDSAIEELESSIREQIAKEIEERAAQGKWLSTRPYKDTTDKYQLHYLAEGMEMAAAIARGQK